MLSMLLASLISIGGTNQPAALAKLNPTILDFGSKPSLGPSAIPQGISFRSRRRSLKGGIEMTYIPEGAFTMGSDAGPPNERPQRRVVLDPYWIGVNDVTVA